MRVLAASLFGFVAVANAQPAADVPPTLDLKVKPLLCIVDERTPQCDMAFLVLWESSRSGDYCLFNDFAAAPVRCWSEQRSGELTEQRVVQQEFRYWMTHEDGASLATVTVEVLRIDDGDRRRKRRSRHVWDLL